MKIKLPKILLFSVLTITPAQIFTDQDQQVLFTLAVDCHGATCPETVELILWKDETHQKSSARWAMQDKGLWGDEKAGDHIYSQIAYFKKSLPTTLYFTTAGNNHAQLQIIPRPTFWELMQGVFRKLKGLSLHAAPESSTKGTL